MLNGPFLCVVDSGGHGRERLVVRVGGSHLVEVMTKDTMTTRDTKELMKSELK